MPWTPRAIPVLYRLVEHGVKSNYGKIELLLDHGGDPNISFGEEGWRKNWVALNLSASRKCWAICELLVERGADVNYPAPVDYSFWTKLKEAGKEYEESGEVPDAYTQLLAHPKVAAQL